jgi:hypothetical protein
MLRLVSILLILSTTFALAQQPAPAPDATLKLSAEDQKNFKEVCAFAMRNAALPTDMTYNVSAWCLAINGKITQALQAPVAPETKP